MVQEAPKTLPAVSLVSLLCAALLFGCNAGRMGDPMGMDDVDLARPGAGSGSNQDGGVTYAARLRGKVVAPEGTIPIAGALVYVTGSQPPPIPDGVYCDRCVRLTEGTPFTTTNPDGTFELGAHPGEALLVVQKGAFRRVRSLKIQAGEQQVPAELTTMPSITNKAMGDDVPKIAVVVGAWDPIEVVLARMGLKAKITKGLGGKARVLGKDAEAFAIYGVQALGETSPYPPPAKLLTDPAEIGKYHIVFLPCSGSADMGGSGPVCSGVFNTDAKVKTTLSEFVRKGGRIYASDWSYEYVRQVFPGFVSWQGETQAIGSACQSGGGDQQVSAQDPGVDAWMKAQGQRLASVKDAWTVIKGVNAQMGLDLDGKPAVIKPKVWVEAASRPVTTSFQQACGRVLYTTYHTQPTEETNAALEPQALALLYLILEVGVCLEPPVIG
jgi:hypothetical protein